MRVRIPFWRLDGNFRKSGDGIYLSEIKSREAEVPKIETVGQWLGSDDNT